MDIFHALPQCDKWQMLVESEMRGILQGGHIRETGAVDISIRQDINLKKIVR